MGPEQYRRQTKELGSEGEMGHGHEHRETEVEKEQDHEYDKPSTRSDADEGHH